MSDPLPTCPGFRRTSGITVLFTLLLGIMVAAQPRPLTVIMLAVSTVFIAVLELTPVGSQERIEARLKPRPKGIPT